MASNFPNSVDNFLTHLEVLASDKPNLLRYQELYWKENRTPTEEDELTNLKILLRDKIISSDDMNTMQDAIVRVQEYFLNEVVPYLDSLEVGALRTDLGDPANLTTTDKTSAINAINELKTKSVPYTGATTDMDLNGKVLKNVSGINLQDVSNDSIFWKLVESSTGSGEMRSYNSDGTLKAVGYTITTDGILSLLNQPYVYAKKTISANISSGVVTKLTFDSEVVDTQSEFSSTTFTPKTTGRYLVQFQSIWGSAPSGDVIHHVYENGGSVASNTAGSGVKICDSARIIAMNAGMTYEFYVTQNNGGTTVSLSQSNLHITKIT